MMTSDMAVNLDMLPMFMKYWIGRNLNCTLVIAAKRVKEQMGTPVSRGGNGSGRLWVGSSATFKS